MDHNNRPNFFLIIFLGCVFISIIKYTGAEDLPCAARPIANRSVVCVCNETYCDTITRDPPVSGQYVAYTSSQSGLRFLKTKGNVQERNSCKLCLTFELDISTKYQTIIGFGGAATDAAAINLQSMSANLQKHLINSYFSSEGNEYNMLRVPIAGSDFSTHGYAYNELPVNDVKLTNFSLSEEDYNYKIPLIKVAMETADVPIKLLATAWSPPAWMKTNNNLSGLGQLKHEYYQTYADYHCKFIAAYAAEGLSVWAITPGNEPTHGLTIDTPYVCLGWTPCQMGKFISEYLGETIRKCTDNTVKILAMDDDRSLINEWWRWLLFEYPKVNDYIEGLAVHFYEDFETNSSVLTEYNEKFPGKILIGTEACTGFLAGETITVDFGCWDRAILYATDILSNMAHNYTGWIDWNLVLNAKGGPNYANNFVDAAVIVLPGGTEFIKQPMFYAIGHFSKFIPRGSVRIKVTDKKRGANYTSNVLKVAFLTPYNTIVFVIYNDARARSIVINLGEKHATVKLQANSITTVEFLAEAGDMKLAESVVEELTYFASIRSKLQWKKMALLPLFKNIFFNCMLFTSLVAFVVADKPCLARAITDQSTLCLCNDTYCDTITRVLPARGRYVAYTSSEAGLRFQKTYGSLQDKQASCATGVRITLDPSTKYQTIEGFGGAVTDAVGIHWKNLSEALQQQLINSYFGDEGLQYNMMRVPIGGCDFSTHPYAYNELPENDAKLTNFSLSYEDYEYKLPFIKAAMQVASTAIHTVASTWSPPRWMKTNNNISSGFLKPEYYQTYADYHVKFIEQYNAEGVPIWGITTTNEPMDGLLNLVSFNSLGWSPSQMGKWIVHNLGPTIRNSTYKDVKILACDDQRLFIPFWFNLLVKEHPKSLEYIDGLAVHYYTDDIASAAILDFATESYPNKFILATEACEGSLPWQEHVVLGSWSRAKTYMTDIITDLNHNVVGWIDWNMCLDLQGGPNWVQNFVDAAIIVMPDKGVFVKQPMYYAQGHLAKFVSRGSRRIRVIESKHRYKHLEHVAFLTPNNTVVHVCHNKGLSVPVTIKLGDKQTTITMPQKSITTIELAYEQNTTEES